MVTEYLERENNVTATKMRLEKKKKRIINGICTFFKNNKMVTE